MVGGLAVLYASIGNGAWARRSAIAWMMGAWGARLAVQGLYTGSVRRATHTEGASGHEGLPGIDAARAVRGAVLLAIAAFVASVPALLAAFNTNPDLSWLELGACALWLVGFAGETTADRQRLRFLASGEIDTRALRAGLWRYSRHADRVFTAMVWAAFVLFGIAAV
jgi:steroid 5-alpha reductase family enzyme